MLGIAGCGHLDSLTSEVVGAVDRCRLFCSVPGPLQSVQRTEIGEAYSLAAGRCCGPCWD